jgi:formiminotetrahydrofolate cyclodeaminase
MKLIDMKLSDFINEVDSPSPAPGGGSVAATAGAMGVALLRMVGHLTVSKKKFLALPEAVQNEFRSTIEQLVTVKDRLMELVDEDTLSFNQIMASYQLPKELPSQCEFRAGKIQEATLGAIRIPLEVATLSLAALESLDVLLKNGNKNALSDLGVGSLMLSSGLEGAVLNVETNLTVITDEATVAKCRQACEKLMTDGNAAKTKVLSEIHRRLQESRG